MYIMFYCCLLRYIGVAFFWRGGMEKFVIHYSYLISSTESTLFLHFPPVLWTFQNSNIKSHPSDNSNENPVSSILGLLRWISGYPYLL